MRRNLIIILPAITVLLLGGPRTAHAGWSSDGIVVGDSAVTPFLPTLALAPDGAQGVYSFANPWHVVTRTGPQGDALWSAAPYVTSFPRGTALVPDAAGGVWVVYSASTDVLAGHWDATGNAIGGTLTVAHNANGTRFLATALSDGAGGFFAVWTDVLASGDDDLRGAHVDASGAVLSPATGTLLVGGFGAQVFHGAVSDGQGGFLLMYPFGGGEDVQRFGSALAPVWPVSAARVQPPGAYSDFAIAASSDGGMFVGWIEYVSSASSVRVQRFDANGGVAAGWPAAGAIVADDRLSAYAERIVADGTGGVGVAWIESRPVPGGTAPDVRVSRLFGDGTRAAGWPAEGVVPGTIQQPALDPRNAIVPDGSGGCFVAWSDMNAGMAVVRAQHLDVAGATVTGWPASGSELGTAEFQSNTAPVLVPNGSGGAFMAWDEYRYPYLAHEGLHVMRLARLLPGGVAGAPLPPLPEIALGLRVRNPVRGSFTLGAVIPDDRAARLELFDVTGRAEFRRDLAGAGQHDVVIDAATAPPGVYWLRLSHPAGVLSARVVVLR